MSVLHRLEELSVADLRHLQSQILEEIQRRHDSPVIIKFSPKNLIDGGQAAAAADRPVRTRRTA